MAKILSSLKKDGFVSGEKLAKKLNVSRTAIWKQIKILQNLGYDIESVKNKGYRLVSRPDTPFPEEITNNLRTNIVGKTVFYFEELESTNITAKEKIKEKTIDGTVVIAGVQKGGKGRKDRKWDSPKGGLWFSVIFYPKIPPQNGMLLTMTSSISVAKAIEELTGLKPVIKWPNDLLLGGKKICGILTELDAEIDRINNAVVGIGINVNNTIPDDLKDSASSLLLENNNKTVSRVDLLRSIIGYLDEYYHEMLSGNYDLIRDIWLSYSNIIGRKIKVKNDLSDLTGIVKDIDTSGCLVLDSKGKKIRVVCGDISYL